MYAESKVSLNRDLAYFDTWDREKFEERERKLVDMAVKIFMV